MRVIVPTGSGHLRSLAGLVRSLQASGRKVLFVSADRPYESLTRVLREFGVATQDMHFVDAVSSMGGSAPAIRPANATFLPSPTMLEMLAMRIEQAALRLGPAAHMVLDSLDTLSLYNGALPVQEFSHYLANRLRSHGVHGDFVVRDSPAGLHLRDLVLPFTDGRVDLPSGEAEAV